MIELAHLYHDRQAVYRCVDSDRMSGANSSCDCWQKNWVEPPYFIRVLP